MSDKSHSVLEIIGKLAEEVPENIKPESELVADLGIDSPKALQLLVELEDALGVEISDDEAAKMETVGDILAFFENR